jgi:hypothetical protein
VWRQLIAATPWGEQPLWGLKTHPYLLVDHGLPFEAV